MSRPERGAYGNKRGKEAQKRKRINRENDKNRAAVMAQLRAERESLDRQIAEETVNPVLGVAAGAALRDMLQRNVDATAAMEEQVTVVTEHGSVGPASEHYFELTWTASRMLGTKMVDRNYRATVPFPPETIQELPRPRDKGADGAIKWARNMFKQGYNVVHVMLACGVGINWLSDFDIDEHGYYSPKD